MNNKALLQTPLFDLHMSLGARMVAFANYNMPVQYSSGVMKEHLHTRTKAGLFDVSHMGQIVLRPKSGDIVDAALALETLVPMDILGLPEGRQRYAFFTNNEGGILDDLMVANRGDHLFLVVNAACKQSDFAHLVAHLSDTCELELQKDRALLALQGPQSAAALGELRPDVSKMRFMDVREFTIEGGVCIVSRSGYTGEDGFEISLPADNALDLANTLLGQESVASIGLGARDSLRLEAGLCLYGSDIDTTTTPVQADLTWAIQKVRRTGGTRSGGFPGADVILEQIISGADRKRVGLRPRGRAPMRSGTKLYADAEASDSIGAVTSGGFGPTIEAPIAIGYVPTEFSKSGTEIFGEVRGKKMPVVVSDLPFVKPNFKRR